MGGEASRIVRLLPRPAWTVNAGCSALPSVSWPIELLALPPDSVQPLFSAAAGRLNGSTCVAGSISTSPSVVRTGMRWPSTGVFGFELPLSRLQPPDAKAAAIRSAIPNLVDLLILVLLGQRKRSA